MYFERQPVAIKCQLFPGAFSGERVFEVTLANGDSYTSLAPRQFCWNSNGTLLEIDEPNTQITGYIAARIVNSIDDEQVIVEVPDGEIIAVESDTLTPRPTPIKPPVSKSYVSVGS